MAAEDYEDDDDYCCPDCGAREDEPHAVDCEYDDDGDEIEEGMGADDE